MVDCNGDYAGKKIGIFGGTFDPPHIGHLILAEEASFQLGLSSLLWVVTPIPPHKTDRRITNIDTRIKLVEAAIKSNPLFAVSTVEIDRQPPYYAVDTLRILRHQYPLSNLIYLIGGDSLHDLPGWHTPELLLQVCEGIGVMRRPNDHIDLADIYFKLPHLKAKINWIEAPLLEISASSIRKKINQNKAYRYYVHPEVFRIIQDEKLYMD